VRDWPTGIAVMIYTQPSITPGLVNEYQLRQVWFIPLADVRGVCRYNGEITRERVPYLSACDHNKALYKSTFTLPYI